MSDVVDAWMARGCKMDRWTANALMPAMVAYLREADFENARRIFHLRLGDPHDPHREGAVSEAGTKYTGVGMEFLRDGDTTKFAALLQEMKQLRSVSDDVSDVFLKGHGVLCRKWEWLRAQ